MQDGTEAPLALVRPGMAAAAVWQARDPITEMKLMKLCLRQSTEP